VELTIASPVTKDQESQVSLFRVEAALCIGRRRSEFSLIKQANQPIQLGQTE
jgi:hypothetical protein